MDNRDDVFVGVDGAGFGDRGTRLEDMAMYWNHATDK